MSFLVLMIVFRSVLVPLKAAALNVLGVGAAYGVVVAVFPEMTLTGYSASLGAPEGRYIAPANSGNCIQVNSGDCAPQSLIVNGPMFARFDMSAVKRVKINERLNFELRGEILNAFNHINFIVGSPNNDVNILGVGGTTFGQITSAGTMRQVQLGGKLLF